MCSRSGRQSLDVPALIAWIFPSVNQPIPIIAHLDSDKIRIVQMPHSGPPGSQKSAVPPVPVITRNTIYYCKRLQRHHSHELANRLVPQGRIHPSQIPQQHGVPLNAWNRQARQGWHEHAQPEFSLR